VKTLQFPEFILYLSWSRYKEFGLMKIEMNDEGGIDLIDIDVDQVCLLVQALQESPNQVFMDDVELKKMFKLLSILQTEVYQDLDSGKVDLTQFKAS
jgi:hypothetical protein